jgi:hypothetical protein
MLNVDITDEQVNKRNVIKKVNEKLLDKRLEELLSVYQDPAFLGQNYEERKLGINNKGSKSKVYRKIASVPIEIDAFFTRIYGADYYKDKKFFKKFPEWLTVKEESL